MQETKLVRQRQLTSIGVLLATTGFMWFGFFMLIPLLAVHITRDLGMGAAIAGLVLAVRQFAQFGLGLFTAALSDSVGYRRMILIGMLVRAVGFVWLGFASDVLTLLLSAAVSAVGGAFFESSGKAALAAISKGYKRETIFSLYSTIGNIGMSLGPLVGVALLKFDFSVVGLASGGMYLINFVMVYLFIPVIAPSSTKRGTRQMFANLGNVWHNRPFVLITVLLVGYYSLYSQINITLPLEATRITNSNDSVSLLYIINSGLAISLQIISLRYLSRWFKPTTIIAVGTLVSALGLFFISFVSTYLMLLACVVVYALGRLVVEPVVAVLVSDYSTEETLASYFGFSSLALGFGGITGSLLGGWLFEVGQQTGLPALCWWFFGLLGVLVVLGVLFFQRYERRVMASNKVTTGFNSAGLEIGAANPNHE